MRGAGIAVEESSQQLAGFAKVATDARMKAGLLADNFGVRLVKGVEGAESGVIRLAGATGQMVRVLRGGASNAITSFSDPLEKLGITAQQIGDDFIKAQINAARSVQEWKKVSPEIAAGLAQAAGFGANWDKATQSVIENAKALEAIKTQTAQIISPEDQKRLDAYNKSWGDLTTTWENLKIEALLAAFPQINFVLKDTEGFIKDSIREWNQLAAAASSAAAAIRAAGAASAPSGESIALTQQFASGGYIRGPGSGTSDSILARLSNGEFVMRAAAVDRWGPQFMMALNNLRNPFGYAGGGLVRTPRFATGGMVTATTPDGTVVNLHFPGGSFALRGDREIVGGLTREARRAGMLSAGKMAGALA
jgi:hypothetical protein